LPIPTTDESVSNSNSSDAVVFAHDENAVLLLTGMGFTRDHVIAIMQILRTNNVESLTEFLVASNDHVTDINSNVQSIQSIGNSVVTDANRLNETLNFNTVFSSNNTEINSNIETNNIEINSNIETNNTEINSVNATINTEINSNQSATTEVVLSSEVLSDPPIPIYSIPLLAPETDRNFDLSNEFMDEFDEEDPDLLSAIQMSMQFHSDIVSDNAGIYATIRNERNEDVDLTDDSGLSTINNNLNSLSNNATEQSLFAVINNNTTYDDELPNLVSDLESLNIDTNQLIDNSSCTTNAISNAVNSVNEASINESTFTRDIMRELNFSLSSPSTELPLPPTSWSTKKNNSISFKKTPEIIVKKETEKDSDAKAQKVVSEFDEQNLKLVKYAVKLCDNVVKSVIRVCSLYEYVLKWGAKDSYALIPHLCDCLVKINEKAKTFIYYDLLIDIENIISKEQQAEQSEKVSVNTYKPNLYGLFYFLIQFLRDITISKEVEKKIDRKLAMSLMSSTLSLVYQATKNCTNELPLWISPALILLYEMLSLPYASREKQPIPLPIRLLQTNRHSEEKEEEEGGVLAESKEDGNSYYVKEDKDNNSISTVGFKSEGTLRRQDGAYMTALPTTVFDDMHLLPDATWEKSFEVVSKLIEMTSTLTLLDAEVCQGILMLLLTLLGRQRFASKFIDNGGLQRVLRFKLCATTVDNQSQILTLIVRKCLETSVELQQEITQTIRAIFNSLPVEQTSISFDRFVHSLGAFLIKSPEDFWQASLNNVSFLKVETNPSQEKAEKSVVNAANEVVHVKLLLKAKTSHNGDELDDRALKTLRTLITHVFYLVKCKSTEDCKKKFVHNLPVVLNALSDSVLSLQRVPLILAKIVKLDGDLAGSKIFNKYSKDENLIDCFILKVFGQSIPQVTGKQNLQKNAYEYEIWSVSRFFVSLCAFRGPSRTVVLNSVIKILKLNATASNHVDKLDALLNSVNAVARENDRVQLIWKLTSLILIVIRASKQSAKEKQQSKGQQGVSVDTVHYLVFQGSIVKLITQALLNISLQSTNSVSAVNALLELLELITKPKLQAHLEKLTELQTTEKVTEELTNKFISSKALSDDVNHSQISSILQPTNDVIITSDRSDVLVDFPNDFPFSNNRSNSIPPPIRIRRSRASQSNSTDHHVANLSQINEQEEHENDEDEEEVSSSLITNLYYFF
jgi:hypothetical protein